MFQGSCAFNALINRPQPKMGGGLDLFVTDIGIFL